MNLIKKINVMYPIFSKPYSTVFATCNFFLTMSILRIFKHSFSVFLIFKNDQQLS